MKKIFMKKVLSLVLACTMMVSLFVVPVKADSNKIVTLGANLSEEERNTVLSFFGITDLNTVQVIEINNEQEHEVLGGKLPEAQIGKKTYSCAYIEPTNSGGINVRTANLTYVSDSTLANALMTAGITDCNLIVTAPFPVSGTGALTGVYKAYEATGNALDSDKMDVAADEMIITSSLEEVYGADINQAINDVKNQVAGRDDLSDDEIRDIIRSTADNQDISLSDEDVEKILSLVKKIIALDYDADAFKSKVNETLSSIADNSGQALGVVQRFFSNIVNFFKGLFGGGSDSGDSDNIFNNINTDIFDWDESSVED